MLVPSSHNILVLWTYFNISSPTNTFSLLLASHIISWCYEFNPTSSLTNASYKLSLLLFFCLKFMSNISIPWLHSYYFTIFMFLFLLLLYVLLRCFLSHGWWEFYLLGWAAPYILSIPTRCQLWLNCQKSNTATSDKEWSTNYHRNLESIIRPYYGITYRDNLCTISTSFPLKWSFDWTV